MKKSISIRRRIIPLLLLVNLFALLLSSCRLLSSCSLLSSIYGTEKASVPTAPMLTTEELEAEAQGLYGDDWVAQLNTAAEGDIITFGFYEQDGDFEDGREPIEWILLKKEDTKLTLVSRYLLDYIDYSGLAGKEDWESNYSWETCYMRRWLHETFLANSFTAEALSFIEPTPFSFTLREEDPPIETVDSAYLLTPEEALHYFPYSPDAENELLCNGTDYCIKICGSDRSDCALRGTVHNEDAAIQNEGAYSNAYAFYYGSSDYIYDSYGFTGAVRPVLTIDTDPDSVAAKREQIEKYGNDQYRKFRCNYFDRSVEEFESEQALIAEYGSEWDDLRLNAVEGEKVTFGCYEQDNDPATGAEPISWLVLKKTDGELWLLSENVLDNVLYDPYPHSSEWEGDNVSWTECSLCHWLNNDFASAAFTEQQLKMLKDSNSVIMENYGEKNVYRSPENESTGAEQPIRLLTADEAISFLFNSEVIINDAEYEASGHKSGYEYAFEYTVPGEGYSYSVYFQSAYGTPYAIANGLETLTDYTICEWWLLTDDFNGIVDHVHTMSGLSEESVDSTSGVRPLICIDLAPELSGAAN